MHALITSEDAANGLRLIDVDEPDPDTDEVVVDVEAFSINRGELRLLAMRSDGWRPGQDVAGVVSRAAADGSGPAVGTRVVAWVDQAGWAQRVAVSTARVVALPDGVETAVAATLPVAGVTALRMLELGGALLGRRVLVTGAAGGVGRLAVELAARAGARVTAVARNAERAAGLEELGAEAVVGATTQADGRFDLILEGVGGESLAAGPSLIAPGGLIVLFGNSSEEPAALQFRDFHGAAGARLQAFFVYESGPPSGFGRDLERLVDLIDRDELHPRIGHLGTWEDPGPALEALRDRTVNGKVVLAVASALVKDANDGP